MLFFVYYFMIRCLWGRGSECNCFLVWGDRLAVVDAGSPGAVLDVVGGLSIPTGYLLITHNHFDHVCGLPVLKNKLGGKLAVHELDADALEAGDSKRVLSNLFWSDCPKAKVDVRLRDGDVLDLGGGVKLEVIHTPGHTPGGVCFYEPKEKVLFSGDTVFADGVGRTDFLGGDFEKLEESVEKLLKLVDERGVETIYPGHGPKASGGVIRNIYEEYFS